MTSFCWGILPPPFTRHAPTSRSSRLGSPPDFCLWFILSFSTSSFQGQSILSFLHLTPGWVACWEPQAWNAFGSSSRWELQAVSHRQLHINIKDAERPRAQYTHSVSYQSDKQHENIICIYATCHYTSQSVTALQRYFTIPMACLQTLEEQLRGMGFVRDSQNFNVSLGD